MQECSPQCACISNSQILLLQSLLFCIHSRKYVRSIGLQWTYLVIPGYHIIMYHLSKIITPKPCAWCMCLQVHVSMCVHACVYYLKRFIKLTHDYRPLAGPGTMYPNSKAIPCIPTDFLFRLSHSTVTVKSIPCIGHIKLINIILD